jgi:hypothetical protein
MILCHVELVDWLVGWLFGSFIRWLFGWLIDCLVG